MKSLENRLQKCTSPGTPPWLPNLTMALVRLLANKLVRVNIFTKNLDLSKWPRKLMFFCFKRGKKRICIKTKQNVKKCISDFRKVYVQCSWQGSVVFFDYLIFVKKIAKIFFLEIFCRNTL